MPLNRQSLPINFAQGLDLKTDPFQVQAGKFLSLQNSIFDKGGMLQKRNGYQQLTVLPSSTEATFLTTFNGNLTAVGNSLQALAAGTETWVNKGALLPTSLNTLPLIRSGTNQVQADSVIAPNGYVCTVFTDNVPVSGTLTAEYKYVIADSVTGQNIVAPQIIPTGSNTITGSPRVFLLGFYFIILISVDVSGSNHLQYIALPYNNPTNVIGPTDISTVYTPASTVAMDGYVSNETLYVVWNGSDGTIKMTYINKTLQQANTISFTSQQSDIFSITADTTQSTSIIWIAWNNSNTEYAAAVDSNLNVLLDPTVISSTGCVQLASTAQNGIMTIVEEHPETYGYDSSLPNNKLRYITITQSGTVSDLIDILGGVGLASKGFLLNGSMYFLTTYQSPLQSTYFLMNLEGQVISELAYSNGEWYGGTTGIAYLPTGLPGVSLISNVASIAYLRSDTVQAQTKNTNAANITGVFSQYGVQLASFTMGGVTQTTAEIGNTLEISGGYLLSYDGYSPVEQGFFVWPDYVEVSTSGSGGSLSAQEYFYQVTYEWTDNQGNINRSAPSIPVSVTTTGTTSSNTINVPTLRLTYKLNNPVLIVIYRWSTDQQVYHQITSISNPILNDPTVDSISYVDTQSDSDIAGNNIIYTTGGVIENIGAPATDLVTLFDTRVWLVDSEDRNLLWYSKQVIESTPVEMSDLLTFYVSPTLGAQGSTGPITALAALDDKLIIFKRDAIYYINGTGPDNTGANSQYSEPVFITATVGCTNQHSIVFMPSGLMFQSDKGIWLLGRDLSTTYIGAPVESLTTGVLVKNSLNIPATNQVRFTLDSGVTLMYDYFFQQWGEFTGIPAISSVLYQNLHTYVDSYGRVFQETPNMYLDNTRPVLMSFATSWITTAGIQGLERFYEMYLLGVYYSPFFLDVQVAYDYNPSPSQSVIVTQSNNTPNWGGDAVWGSNQAWGGPGNIFKARVFPDRQKLQSFQIIVNEQYDSTYGQPAGQGLTLSGVNIIYGTKKGSRNSPASRNFG